MRCSTADERATRRHLAAILALDIAGYSRLMHDDEQGTLSGCCSAAAWSSTRGFRSIAVASVRDRDMLYFRSDPFLDPLCADPRFKALDAKMDFP